MHLVPPHYDVSKLAMYGDIEDAIRTAWDITEEYSLMLLVLQVIDVETRAHVEKSVRFSLGGADISRTDPRLYREGPAIVRKLVPHLPALPSLLRDLREKRRVYTPPGFIPDSVLSSTSRDQVRNILLEISSYGRPACTMPGRNSMCEGSIQEAWSNSTLESRILLLRLIRPSWWNWFTAELALCVSEEGMNLLVDGVARLLPSLQEIARSAPAYQYDPFPDPFS